jgi:hypothetical protein
MMWPNRRLSSLFRPTPGALPKQKQSWLPTGGGACATQPGTFQSRRPRVMTVDRPRPIRTETTRATTAKRLQPREREDRTTRRLPWAFLRRRTPGASTTTSSGFRSSTHSDSLNACVRAATSNKLGLKHWPGYRDGVPVRSPASATPTAKGVAADPGAPSPCPSELPDRA